MKIEKMQACFRKILVGDPLMDFFSKHVRKNWHIYTGKISLKSLIVNSLTNLTEESMGHT
jgi:hypothetical protein